jgi:RNA polymerase-binding transcription factor DksA
VVFFVAVPLCLGIALASGAPLFAGIIAGIVGGIVVGIASGSPLGVSGPAAGLAVIVLTSIATLGGSYQAFLTAVVIAGVIQLALGYAKPVAKAPVKPVVAAKPVEKYVPPAKPVPVIPTPPVKPVRKAAEPIKDIKVPKINAKNSVPYQPGYVPMEKRKEVERSTETLVKYSDAELAEFRDLISKKLEAAKKELVYLQGLITRKDEMGGDNDDARYMTMEDGSVSMEREQMGQMASRQITFIDHLEKALMRIENKTYGICRVTGRLIDKARLRAVPHATLSLEAKLGYVKNSSDQ